MSDLTQTTPKKRVKYIDALRGFTMILVVFHHIIMLSFEAERSFLVSLINSFHMPLFFFLSGLIGYKAKMEWSGVTWCTMCGKKILTLLLPTSCFCLIYVYLYRHLDIMVLMKDNMKLGYWFTIVLFEMFLLMYTMNVVLFSKDEEKFKKRMLIALVVVSVFAFGLLSIPSIIPSVIEIFNFFSLYQLLIYFLYFAFGYICSMYKEIFDNVISNKYFTTIIIVLFAVLFYVDSFYLSQNANRGFWQLTLLHILFNKSIGLLGLLIVFNIFRVYKDFFTIENKIGRAFQFIGKRTLDIYLLHYFFLPSLPQVGKILNDNSSTLELFIGGGLSLIVIALCLVVSNILRTSPILAKYLFGTKN